MCKSPLHPFLAALPKCEHHIHLEGSLSPELLFALSAKNSVPLPSAAEDPAFASPGALRARYEAFTSLDDFLHYYYVGFTVLLTANDFELLAYEYLSRVAGPSRLPDSSSAAAAAASSSSPQHQRQHLHQHLHHEAANVRHAELFFDPQPHLSRGLTLDTVIGGITRARERAEADFGVTSLLIPCLLRHLPVHEGEATFAALRDGGFFHSSSLSSPLSSSPSPSPPPSLSPPRLAGLGICSSELNVPPASSWAPVFRAAAALLRPEGDGSSPRAGDAAAVIRTTAHAGEEGPASAVTDALDVLGVSRIDHGVRAAEDPEVVGRLAREGTLLTVCPMSNVRLKGVERMEQVPIRTFLEAGVRFSINSDDPAYFGGYILENYCAVQEAFSLSVDEWAFVCRAAIEGSWCGDERKGVLLGELHAVVEEWRGRLLAETVSVG